MKAKQPRWLVSFCFREFMQLLLQSARFKTVERDSDSPNQSMQTPHQTARWNTTEARRTCDSFPAKQEFVSRAFRIRRATNRSPETWTHQAKQLEAGVKTTVCFRASGVPVTTRTSGCSVTAHSQEPVPAAVSQFLYSSTVFPDIGARCPSRATVKGNKSLLALQLLSVILFFKTFSLRALHLEATR